LLACWGAADALGPLCRVALAEEAAADNKSWWDSMTSSIKNGFNKVGNALNPYPKSTAKVPGPEDDAISLKTKGKAGPDLYVAMAHFFEQSGRLAEAEQQYQLALKEKGDNLPALLGYAQLKEELRAPDEAIRLYQQAVKTHPREASVYNNMGLCYARLGRLDDATAALTSAVALAPRNPLYHNNIALVLVDRNRLREAFAHLKEAQGEAAAYYNMGCLLNKKGNTRAAMQHFALALRANPSMVAAQQGIDYLQRSTMQSRLPQRPSVAGGMGENAGNAISRDANFQPPEPSRSGSVTNYSQPPADEPSTRRLPPIVSGDAGSESPALPGISYGRSAVPNAPLPPPSATPAVEPLPRVN
jgi:tetratricopeptide (TPR) repeat protein